ncbi:hypothetical protein Poly51_39140 [Rubripirellula tenax]|uniref:Uncharacterized protein n=1 Tax=Rubripirellula tenax TaxID=2528015 RepID=A0A5C6ENF2_9BACT|nr:hypothetical protein Poly51_39140 [Rubripirellula tenax]
MNMGCSTSSPLAQMRAVFGRSNGLWLPWTGTALICGVVRFSMTGDRQFKRTQTIAVCGWYSRAVYRPLTTHNNASPSHKNPDNFVRNGNPLAK